MLKQNLRIKTFVGIALLLLNWGHHLSRTGWSFAIIATMHRINLLTYRSWAGLLDDPYQTPPVVVHPIKHGFSFADFRHATA